MRCTIHLIIAIASSFLSVQVLASEATSTKAIKSSASVLEQVQTQLYDLMDKDITSINFPKGGYALSEAEQRNLNAVYKSVLQDSSIQKIIIASWADREGIKTDQKLTEAHIDLAEKRAESVRKALSDLGAKDIEVHNMAKDASWIEKTFRTDDAKLKKAVKGGQVDDKAAHAVAQILEERGGPGRAVMIVQRGLPQATGTR